MSLLWETSSSSRTWNLDKEVRVSRWLLGTQRRRLRQMSSGHQGVSESPITMKCWIDLSCECPPECFRDVEFDSSTNTVTRVPDSRPMCPLVYWAELDRHKEDTHLDRYLGNTENQE